MKIVYFLFCIALLWVAGCKGNLESNLAGKWKGEIKFAEKSKDDPGADFAKGMLKMMGMDSFDLLLKQDRTFSLTMGLFPIEGDWKVEGDSIALTAKKVMGLTPDEMKEYQKKKGSENSKAALIFNQNDPSKPLRLRIEESGKTLRMTDGPSDSLDGDLIFTKQSS